MSKYIKTLIILLLCLSLTFSELEIIQGRYCFPYLGKASIQTRSMLVFGCSRMEDKALLVYFRVILEFPEQQTSSTLELEGNGQPLQFGTFQPIAQQGAAGTANSQ